MKRDALKRWAPKILNVSVEKRGSCSGEQLSVVAPTHLASKACPATLILIKLKYMALNIISSV